MIFENDLFNISFLIGLLFILAGLILNKYPPKKINILYGYRTLSSMENQKRWDFAQIYSSKELMKSGFFLMISSPLGFIFSFDYLKSMIIGFALIVCMIAILFYRVEKAIKDNFAEK